MNCEYELFSHAVLPCKGKSIDGMSCIPSGTMIRGSNKFEPNERPEHSVFVGEFWMDQFEVTNLDFQLCLEAGYCKDCLKNQTCDFIGARYGKIYQRPKQPVLGVSWYTATEYCHWKGKRLPTEAEWEKAARGEGGDLYPWGNEEPSCKLAVIEVDGKKGCFSEKLEKPHWMTTDDVGKKPVGRYGLYDMAGNSWEWVSDWYSESYEKCGSSCLGDNPKGPCNGNEVCSGHTQKIVKGGSWWWPGTHARGSFRRAHVPKNYPEYHHFGFRCAKNVE
ncbi:MAG: SUMF1/EgtB/PvdO family nonheme iron enzyme [Leptospira sp.]|nr:SUMF1/EgtB/PvdO family nonheme iron enzyme [Leptospira sp.]